MDKFCSVYKSNLSGGLTSLEDLPSGASGAGPLNCGVLAGTSEASVVCSHVGKLSLGKVLGVVLWTSFRGVDGSITGVVALDTNFLSCWPNVAAVSPEGTAICHGDGI